MRFALALRLAVIAALLCSVGCNSKNKGKIEGKWSSLATTMNVKGKMVDIPADAATLEFTKDGKLIYTIGQNAIRGTYSLGWGDTVTLKFDQEFEGRKNHTEKIAINGDKLTMTDSDGTAVSFRRIQ